MIIGFDIGGTKISWAFEGQSPFSCAGQSFATPLRYADFLDKISHIGTQHPDITMVGLGSAGSSDGNSIDAHNLPFLKGRSVFKDLERILDCPIKFVNDASAFVLAECAYGAGRGDQNVIGLILGTGLGSGLYLNDQLYIGCNGRSGEMLKLPFFDPVTEHWSTDPEGLLAGGGVAGLMERFGVNAHSAVDLNAELEKGCLQAQACFEAYVDRLSSFLMPVLDLIGPDCLVLGGGVSSLLGLDSALTEALAKKGHAVVVRKAELGTDSGKFGAIAFCQG